MILIFQNCENANNLTITVEKQELLHDSLNTKDKIFKIILFSYINFENKTDKSITINRIQYNDYYTIIRKDTLPLVPKNNNYEITIPEKSSVLLRYVSYPNIKVKEYNSDSLTQEIRRSKIYNYTDKKVMEKDNGYNIISTIYEWKAPSQPEGVKNYE